MHRKLVNFLFPELREVLLIVSLTFASLLYHYTFPSIFPEGLNVKTA